MVDSLYQAARSAVMARVRGKNTRPEMIVRKLVFGKRLPSDVLSGLII